MLIHDQLDIAFPEQMSRGSIHDTAKTFGENVSKIQFVSERRQSLTQNKWTSQVGQFFTKMIPITKLSLGIVGAVAEV